MVEKGDRSPTAPSTPRTCCASAAVHAVYDYLIQEVQKPYRQQGVDINDKHIEVICRQMMRKVRVEDAGDSDLLSGSTIDIIEFWDAKRRPGPHRRRGDQRRPGAAPAHLHPLLMGITKASLATDSFLSAASFQGDHQGPHRGRHQGQGGPPAGPEGERHQGGQVGTVKGK